MSTLRLFACLLASALAVGCATQRALSPFPAAGPDAVGQGVADVLILAVNRTRASGRELGGWCWSDARTGELTQVVRGNVGDESGVGLMMPMGRRGDLRLSCSWHTHAWDPRAVPGPSRQDLRNSELPQLSDINHFVLDRQGIWKYARGEVLAVCPWNARGSNFDAARCRF
jgi:hypothetical protein